MNSSLAKQFDSLKMCHKCRKSTLNREALHKSIQISSPFKQATRQEQPSRLQTVFDWHADMAWLDKQRWLCFRHFDHVKGLWKAKSDQDIWPCLHGVRTCLSNAPIKLS